MIDILWTWATLAVLLGYPLVALLDVPSDREAPFQVHVPDGGRMTADGLPYVVGR